MKKSDLFTIELLRKEFYIKTFILYSKKIHFLFFFKCYTQKY